MYGVAFCDGEGFNPGGSATEAGVVVALVVVALVVVALILAWL